MILYRITMELKSYYTPQQIIDMGIKSRKWVYAAVKLGKIKGVKAGRFWLIPKNQLKLIKSGKIKITAEELGNKRPRRVK